MRKAKCFLLFHLFTLLPLNAQESKRPKVEDRLFRSEVIEQKIKEMSQAELEKLLAGAVESEDFELASKIHDEMERRKH